MRDVDPAIRAALIEVKESEFATLTPSGQPISNPLFHYHSADADSIDIATGLAYPAKANRARQNSKVGLVLGPAVHARDPMAIVEAGAPESRALDNQPVIAIAAEACVRDADLQANTDRYVARFLAEHPKIGPSDWETMRTMTNYWVRIWVECRPVAMYFWPTGNLDEEQPVVWRAGGDLYLPPSDAAPDVAPAQPKRWPAEPWQDRAADVLPKFPNPILSTVNPDGYPVPLPVQHAEVTAEGFALRMPRFCPWTVSGKACLTFGALATFVGEVTSDAAGERFVVHRLIGNLPSVFENESEQAQALKARLETELQSRNQPMPVIRKTA